jgi:hypothetical protein
MRKKLNAIKNAMQTAVLMPNEVPRSFPEIAMVSDYVRVCFLGGLGEVWGPRRAGFQRRRRRRGGERKAVSCGKTVPARTHRPSKPPTRRRSEEGPRAEEV